MITPRSGNPGPTISNSPTQDEIYILKRLFFNDLYFFYYDFCYRMNNKFSEKNDICLKKLKDIGDLLTDIRKIQTISSDELGFNSLNKYTSRTFNIYTFSKILEDIVWKTLRIDDETIHGILHFYLDSDLYQYDNIEKYFFPYRPIHHLIKLQNTPISFRENEETCLSCQHTISFLREYVSQKFEKTFLDFQTLNIIEEFKNRFKSPEDTRFRTYKDSVERIGSCKKCKKYCENMLRNVRCSSHQHLLNEIRAEFFAFMDCSWIVDSLLINKNITAMIRILALSKDRELIRFQLKF